jgi:hypothetical protein
LIKYIVKIPSDEPLVDLFHIVEVPAFLSNADPFPGSHVTEALGSNSKVPYSSEGLFVCKRYIGRR